VVCDNLRSGVTRPHRYEPDVNATFAEMAAHYGVAVIPARAYKPRDKAKAESGVLIAERWIIARLRDRRFCPIGEANAAIAACVAEINARPFQKKKSWTAASTVHRAAPGRMNKRTAGTNSRRTPAT
jgi:transposase